MGTSPPAPPTAPRPHRPHRNPWHGSEAHPKQPLGSAGPRAPCLASRRHVAAPHSAQLLPAWKPCTLHGAARYPEERTLLQEDRHESQQGPLRDRQGEGSGEGEDSWCAAPFPRLLLPPPVALSPSPRVGARLLHVVCARAPAHSRPPPSMPSLSTPLAWPFQPVWCAACVEQESPRPPLLRRSAHARPPA